jgi:hypothetical protein
MSTNRRGANFTDDTHRLSRQTSNSLSESGTPQQDDKATAGAQVGDDS